MRRAFCICIAALLCLALAGHGLCRPLAFAAEPTGETEEPPVLLADAGEEPAAEKEGLTERLATWFMGLFSESGVGGEVVSFLASLLPIIECRGGMIIAKIFKIPFWKAFVICYIGNIIPIPFILLFIRKIFEFMKKHNILKAFIEKLEGKGDKNRDKVMRFKQWGLLFFVAIPLPGTGGWTGSLIAAMLDIDFKKSLPIIAIGVLIADVIMSVLVYGTGAVFGF